MPLVAAASEGPSVYVRDGENGLLVDFFDVAGLASTIVAVLENPEAYRAIRQAARATAVDRYDLATVCLPAHVRLIEHVVAHGKAPD